MPPVAVCCNRGHLVKSAGALLFFFLFVYLSSAVYLSALLEHKHGHSHNTVVAHGVRIDNLSVLLVQ